MLVTRELLAGIYGDVVALTGEATDLRSPAGARLNMLRIIAAGEPSEHARDLVEREPASEREAKQAADLVRARDLMHRCLPLMNEGVRYITTTSVTYAVEQFLAEPLQSLYR